MSTRKLPESAYAAMRGLKMQAAAAGAMLGLEKGKKSRVSREDLNKAHAVMQENHDWVCKIINKLMKGSDGKNMETIDEAWLEANFE